MDIGRTNKRISFCRYEDKENALMQTEKVLTTDKNGLGERRADKGQRVPRGAADQTGINL